MVRQVGDYGDVAVMLRQEQAQQGPSTARFGRDVLSLDSIVRAMAEMNSLTGGDSQQMKTDRMVKLYRDCQSLEELRFLVRSFANTGLRIGLSTKSVENCILEYFTTSTDENSVRRLEDFERNIFGYRIQKLHLMQGNPEAVYNVPIKPMVGRAAKDPQDVLKVLGKDVNRSGLVADFKYDGERTQLHYSNQRSGALLKMFSRACDSQNRKFWHFEGLLKERLPPTTTSDFIIDGEIVYVDR